MKNKIEEIVDDILNDLKKDCLLDIDKKLQKALNQPAKISIEKFKDGTAKTQIKGTKYAILIALAGLETNILEYLNISSESWEFIKKRNSYKGG